MKKIPHEAPLCIEMWIAIRHWTVRSKKDEQKIIFNAGRSMKNGRGGGHIRSIAEKTGEDPAEF